MDKKETIKFIILGVIALGLTGYWIHDFKHPIEVKPIRVIDTVTVYGKLPNYPTGPAIDVINKQDEHYRIESWYNVYTHYSNRTGNGIAATGYPNPEVKFAERGDKLVVVSQDMGSFKVIRNLTLDSIVNKNR